MSSPRGPVARGSRAPTEPSLKGRALRWLSQREHSRLELRAKLLRAAGRATAQIRSGEGSQGDDGDELEAAPASSAGRAAEIDLLLDWLTEHGYLSDARFAESRIRARAARLGGERILRELKQHGVAPDPEALLALRDSELERATALWQRKFGRHLATAAPAAGPAEEARQIRFLMGRGFSAETARRVLRRRGETPE